MSQPTGFASIDSAYTYQVVATDPNGDTLTYELLDGPAGMTMDAATGVLSWQPDSSAIGAGFKPNLETILELEPDLILRSKVIERVAYRRLSRIAPTTLLKTMGVMATGKNTLLLHADGLGQLAEAVTAS